MFDAATDTADERAFAERCEDDRHHFRFIISPEDGAELGELKTFVFARDLLNTLRRRELDDAVAKLATETGLAHQPSADGEYVAGTYRQRVTLASGRFAMIDDGFEFQLVPWRPALEQKLGQHVTGTLTPGGAVDWTFEGKRGLGI
jgi:uncharacterized protein DUF3363